MQHRTPGCIADTQISQHKHEGAWGPSIGSYGRLHLTHCPCSKDVKEAPLQQQHLAISRSRRVRQGVVRCSQSEEQAEPLLKPLQRQCIHDDGTVQNAPQALSHAPMALDDTETEGIMAGHCMHWDGGPKGNDKMATRESSRLISILDHPNCSSMNKQ